MKTIGDKIDLNVILQNQDGVKVNLSDLLTGDLLIYFYPKDETPGCTKEACNFRDVNSKLGALGVNVIGVSRDSVKSHKKFSDKHKLNFDILSDPDLVLHNIFGTWGEKSLFGHKFMGTLRTTFLVDSSGTIIFCFNDVDVDKHADQVISKIKELKNL